MPEQRDPTYSLANPTDEVNRLRMLVVEQVALIEQLREWIQELEARLAQDSHNSSQPPSSDPPFWKVVRSQRQASGRQPGGQPGRHGVTCRLVEDPDQRVIVPLTGTCTCGRDRAELATEVLAERRQVIEVVIQRRSLR